MYDVTLECENGHKFIIAARSIDRNKGCPVCRGYRKDSTSDVKHKCELLGFHFR